MSLSCSAYNLIINLVNRIARVKSPCTLRMCISHDCAIDARARAPGRPDRPLQMRAEERVDRYKKNHIMEVAGYWRFVSFALLTVVTGMSHGRRLVPACF